MPREWQRHDLFGERPDPRSFPVFRFNGTAMLVPALHWLREYSYETTAEDVAAFYDRYFSARLGKLVDFSLDERSQVLDFAFTQMALGNVIGPLAKQSKLLYDEIFLISEYEVGEDIGTKRATPGDEHLMPRLAPGIGIPDTIMLPQHMLLGFAARIMAVVDNKDRRLRRPGWTRTRNFDHLKNYNHALNELIYIRIMTASEAVYAMGVPRSFARVAQRKAVAGLETFNGSPSVDLLCPDLAAVPWDELVDIADTGSAHELRHVIRDWDGQLVQDPRTDWVQLGRRLQPILDELLADVAGQNVTKTRAWVALGLSLLPFPLGAVSNVADVANAHLRTSISTTVSKLRKKR